MKINVLIFMLFLVCPLLSFNQKPDVVITTGHTQEIIALAFSPDGTVVASSGLDKTITLWDVATGKEFRKFLNTGDRMQCLRFHETKPYLCAAGEKIVVWNYKTGALLYTIEGTGANACGWIHGKIVFIDKDHDIASYDNENKRQTKLIKLSEDDNIYHDMTFTLLHDMKHAMLLDMKGHVHIFNLVTGERQKQFMAKKGIPVTRWAVSHDNQLIAAQFSDNKIHVFDIEKEKITTTYSGHDTRLWDIIFKPGTHHIISTDMLRNIKLWDGQNGKTITEKIDNDWYIRSLASHPSGDIFIGSARLDIKFFTSKGLTTVDRLTAMGRQIMKLAYDQQGKYLVSSHVQSQPGIKVWNLKTNKIDKVIPGAFFPVAITPDGRKLVAMKPDLKLGVWDIRTATLVHEMETGNELIQCLTFSKDGKYLSGGGFNSIVKVWDMTAHELSMQLPGHAGGIYETDFSPDNRYIASASMDQAVKIWDMETGDEMISLTDENMVLINSVAFSNDGTMIAAGSWDQKARIWNTPDWSLKHVLEGHGSIVTDVCFTNDGQYLLTAAGHNIVTESDNNIRLWDTRSGEKICKMEGHSNIIKDLVMDQNSDLLYSAGHDGKINLWRATGCKNLVSFIAIGEQKDFIMITRDNYYMATRDALKGVAFRVNDRLYPFEQFDLRLNRPDIVASRIGKSSRMLINAYHEAYKKRLKRMNFTEDMLGDDFHLPTTELVDKDLPLVVKSQRLGFKVKARDDKYKLDRINVHVNDVPVYGRNGINLRPEHVNQITKDVEVPLLKGKNKIQVSSVNVKGAESLRETFEVVRDAETDNKSLYIVTIGVSEYRDTSFSLKYPVKDAVDFIETMKQSSIEFNHVKSKTLRNEEVTIENIVSLKSFLHSAGPEDIVIIFVAGHGVLDSKLDYYFGTYDMDFNNPASRGLRYDVFEQLLDGTRSLRKLLIMDSCHSGEVDKDNTRVSLEGKVAGGTLKYRAAGLGTLKKRSFGLINTFELMNTVFADLRKGTGATIISSAGGAEYAIEGDQWKNGLFTYCLLNGLKTREADLDNDGYVMLSELKEYVQEKVERLSRGQQQPTSRIENITMDFRIW